MTDSISFTEFTLEDGNPVFINVAQIVSFEPSDEQTLITLTNGRCLTVRDTPLP